MKSSYIIHDVDIYEYNHLRKHKKGMIEALNHPEYNFNKPWVKSSDILK